MGGGGLFEVFGRRLVSRVLFSLFLLLANGGVFFLRFSTLPYSSKTIFSTFLPPLYETGRGSEGGLMN